MSHTTNNSVLFNVDQTYPETSTGGASKQRARNNIGAAAASDLSAEITRATAAEKAAKTEVVAGTNISVTPSTSIYGQTVYTVSSNNSSEYFKTKQNPIDQSYADYGFVKRLRQTANGEVGLECSYISAATSSTTGLLSSTDKSKLDGIQSGAEVNQNAFSTIKVGSNNILADSKQSTFELKAGSNILLTPDTANDAVTISATGTVPTAGPTDYHKVLSVLDTNGTVGWDNSTKIVTRTAPYSVAVPITDLTIFDPGERFGSVLSDQNSNNIGFLLPRHYGNQDLGKVPMVVSDNGYKVEWRDPAENYPEIQYMAHTSFYASSSAADNLYLEDGVCYDIYTMTGGSFTIYLGTDSTKTIHSKLYLWGERQNCVIMTIVYEDEAGEVQQLNFQYGDSQDDTAYILDVFARKVTITPLSGQPFDETLCRIYDAPCQTRSYFSTDNNDIGLLKNYVEPL